MIASVFHKTRPLNYVILSVLLLVCFFCYFFFNNLFQNGWFSVGYFVLYFGLILASTGLVNFIVLKNNLSKGNNFTELLFVCFLLFFPEIFKTEEILIANFFLLLAFRRLLSLRSMVGTKEKLFDASFWIFIAALFHFWAIIYIVLVFVSIILGLSRDYKNWLIPFIAFFVVAILFTVVNLWFDNQILYHLLGESYVSFNFYYFENVYQNIALAVFSSLALLFFVNMFFTINSKPLNYQSTFKRVIAAFVLAVIIFVVSAEKSNAILVYTLAPISIMGANYIQNIKNRTVQEIMLLIVVMLSFFFFIMSL